MNEQTVKQSAFSLIVTKSNLCTSKRLYLMEEQLRKEGGLFVEPYLLSNHGQLFIISSFNPDKSNRSKRSDLYHREHTF